MSIHTNGTSQVAIDNSSVSEHRLTGEQRLKFEGYAAEIFGALGMDMNSSATQEPPRRYIPALFDATDGYDGDPKLIKVFDTECRGEPDCRLSQVIEGPSIFSFCEHHAFPFFGRAYIGYIAHENILGISKLTRLVRVSLKRFSVQERIGQQIADALETMIKPHGVARISGSQSLVSRNARGEGGRAQNPHNRIMPMTWLFELSSLPHTSSINEQAHLDNTNQSRHPVVLHAEVREIRLPYF